MNTDNVDACQVCQLTDLNTFDVYYCGGSAELDQLVTTQTEASVFTCNLMALVFGNSHALTVIIHHVTVQTAEITFVS